MEAAGAAAKPVLELTGIGKEFGAIRALHDVDLQDAGKFTLVVADTLKMQLELLRDGYSNALTGQRPFEMGEKAMDALLAIKKGEKIPEVIYTGLDLEPRTTSPKMLK